MHDRDRPPRQPRSAPGEALGAGLTDQQRGAVEAVSGPVVIHAGAGTGKTTVIAHRTAHAARTGAMDPGSALLLTFTDRAAGEMAARVAGLGVSNVAAMTFHKAAWRQLRHFWPRSGGDQLQILNQSWQIVAPLVRRLPGNYRFTPTADVLDAISWAITARVDPDDLDARAAAAERTLPIPADLLARVWQAYQRAKDDRGMVDFDDMIVRNTDLLRARPDFADEVRARYRWFSVDEFQDTNPAQFELLQVWLGNRDDLGVVGDEHQTIYSFAGATSVYLRDFHRWYPAARSFDLTINHRSTPQILGPANRLLPDALRLSATAGDGPEPTIVGCDDEAAEATAVVRTLHGWRQAGVEFREMAVLVRLNADIPALEAACTRAQVPYQVRGTAFFERRDVREAVRRLAALAADDDIATQFEGMLAQRMGFEPDDEPATSEARERHSALSALVQIVRDHADGGLAALNAELERRREAESAHAGTGVTIATLHRVKGLEWDAVVIPGLEEGHLPVKQAKKSPALRAEERRLLYVGITRARRDLVLSYARQRNGRPQRRSTFLDAIDPQHRAPSRIPADTRANPAAGDDPLYEHLKRWRLEVARAEGVPAYVVFSNSTLALVARDQPRDLTALAAISGVGPTKLERYGTQVLAVVAAGIDD